MSEKTKEREISYIRLDKGMTKDEVNNLVSEWILLEEDIYLGSDFKHSWKCKCGEIMHNRAWRVIKKGGYLCENCKRRILMEDHKKKIEQHSEFKYIKSLFEGDVSPNGDTIKKGKTYAQYIHLYCGKLRTSRIDYISCTNCCGSYENSLAHYIEQELCLKIEDIWDFDKNTINPYYISKGSHTKVWIKCQNEDVNKLNGLKKKDYHNSYEINCNNFVKGARCGYCNLKNKNKSHIYDSFGYYNLDKIMSWHPDNEVNPFKAGKNSGQICKFICPKCNNLFEKRLADANKYGIYCSECSMSEGEKIIFNFLNYNNIEFEYEKTYDGLVGVGKGNLSYDFYLPNCNLLIEYQGEFHDKTAQIQTSEELKRQQEHDRRKREYAKNNGIKLLEIWYYEFDKIKNILERELKYEKNI